MKALFHLAAEIQDICISKSWPFCFIGGIALQRWGEPRLTVDVDLSLFTGYGKEGQFIDAFLKKYEPRIQDAREFALQNRVILIKSERDISVDIVLAGLPFEEQAVSRATDFSFLEAVTLRTCSAEDLIIYKVFADRNRDWADIEGILVRQKGKLDWSHIEKYLLPLSELKEIPHVISKLNDLRSSLA